MNSAQAIWGAWTSHLVVEPVVNESTPADQTPVRLRRLMWLCLSSVLYFLVAKFGMAFISLQPDNITLLWLPSGLAFAMCLQFDRLAWPWIFAASFAANFSGMMVDSTLVTVMHTSASAGIDTFAGAFAAGLYRRQLPGGLTGIRCFLPFVSVALLTACLTGVLLAVNLYSGAYLGFADLPHFVVMITLADSLGILLIAPIFLGWRPGLLAASNTLKTLTVFFSFLTVVMVGYAVSPISGLAYLILPTLLLMSFHAGMFFVSLACLLSLLALTVLSTTGIGDFSTSIAGGSYEDLLVYLVATSLTSLGISLQNLQLTEHQNLMAFIQLKKQELQTLALDLEDKRGGLEAALSRQALFLASMGHELRTPLNAIIGFAQMLHLLTEEAPDADHDANHSDAQNMDRQRAYISDILYSGKYLLEMVNNMLVVNAFEVDAPRVSIAETDLRMVIINTADFHKDQATRKGLTVILEDLPRMSALTDGQRVSQIVSNFISNAVKYTSEGHIVISARILTTGIQISVKDTGEGIAPGEQKQIFEKFHRAESSDLVAKTDGVGLGLYLCSVLANAIGAEITLSSEVGRGSVFSLFIPHGG